MNTMTGTSKYNNLFVVDVEATDKTPATGVMTEFGVVHVVTGKAFYAHLYNFHPHPDIPALPVIETDDNGNPVVNPYWDAIDADGVSVRNRHPRLDRCATELRGWVHGFGVDRPTLVSDNNGFDAMWLNCFTDAQIKQLVFGHSSRRIGDFYAGTQGQWDKQSAWKRLRDTPHTHNPVDDARGNAEALRKILGTL